MAVWRSVLAAAAVAIALILVSCGGGSEDEAGRSSRFQAIHTFSTPDYHSLAFHPAVDVVFFGHHNGLQKSEDGGKTWENVMDEDGWDAMNTVFDAFSPETIYAAGHNVFFRSNDRGQTWEEVRPNLPSLDLHTFAASPNMEGRLYAIPAGDGLYVSEDRGQNWKLVSADVPRGSNSVVELPDGTLLLGATDQGILRSEDGGKTWSQSRTGIDLGVIYAIEGDPSGGRLYAGTDHGVYGSGDGGKTWAKTSLDDAWIITIGVDPSDPNTLLAIDRAGRLYRSADAGTTWGEGNGESLPA